MPTLDKVEQRLQHSTFESAGLGKLDSKQREEIGEIIVDPHRVDIFAAVGAIEYTAEIQKKLQSPLSLLNRTFGIAISEKLFREEMAHLTALRLRLQKMLEDNLFYRDMEKSRLKREMAASEEMPENQNLLEELDKAPVSGSNLLNPLQSVLAALRDLMTAYTTFKVEAAAAWTQAREQRIQDLSQHLVAAGAPPLTPTEVNFMRAQPNLQAQLMLQPEFFTDVLKLPPQQVTYPLVKKHESIGEGIRMFRIQQARMLGKDIEDVDSLVPPPAQKDAAGNVTTADTQKYVLTNKQVLRNINTLLTQVAAQRDAEETKLFTTQQTQQTEFMQKFETLHTALSKNIAKVRQEELKTPQKDAPQFNPHYLMVGNVAEIVRELDFLLGKTEPRVIGNYREDAKRWTSAVVKDIHLDMYENTFWYRKMIDQQFKFSSVVDDFYTPQQRLELSEKLEAKSREMRAQLSQGGGDAGLEKQIAALERYQAIVQEKVYRDSKIGILRPVPAPKPVAAKKDDQEENAEAEKRHTHTPFSTTPSPYKKS